MNIQHHINDSLLVSYAAGGLSEAWSLLVATHAALCPICRERVSDAEAIGGALIEELEPVPLSHSSFADVLGRVDNEVEIEAVVSEKPTVIADGPLPEPLRSYVIGRQDSALPWRRLGLGAFHISISMQDRTASARLLRIPAGRPVPEHGHGGLELTLVLSGTFTDSQSRFGPGDVEEADEGLVHTPHAVAGEDCICLAVTDAPLRFSSRIVRMMQPLLNI
jgi:putative transcriptional regulator